MESMFNLVDMRPPLVTTLSISRQRILSTNTYLRANFRLMGRFSESYDKSFNGEKVTTADGRVAEFKTGENSELKDWLAWGDRDAVAQIDSNWANHFGTPGADSFAGSTLLSLQIITLTVSVSNAMVLVVEDIASLGWLLRF